MVEETEKYITESQENISEAQYSCTDLNCLNINVL